MPSAMRRPRTTAATAGLSTERDETPGGRRGATHDMHEDVDSPETFADRVGNDGAAFSGRDVRGDRV